MWRVVGQARAVPAPNTISARGSPMTTQTIRRRIDRPRPFARPHMASTFPPPQPLPFLARLRRGPSLCNDRNGSNCAVRSRSGERPESALPGRLRACRRRTGIHASEPFRTRSASECLGRPEMLSSVCRCSGTSGVAITIEKSPNCWRIFPAGGGSPTTASGRRMVRIGSSAYSKYHRGRGTMLWRVPATLRRGFAADLLQKQLRMITDTISNCGLRPAKPCARHEITCN